ncbi:MAG: aspartate aminotransferase family protein [candidate division KSB1 bacterium]|nr:aspartate aminotransferase family protein [candidate division KSB1 bacterium]MDZ7274626.1 aspartate aminotransferase family protein [candidate division KSB1 bacterium]MDZ7285451.1 aspartate aminotransferase family protein [candidate division KSB1 bacterium]MDZ7298483.1 aspartate aminotransferase family protein [candidate division KSB1 bacterium]MDZ7306967.1 aspartate aminotransferase family protein [candidate division KSB1 bacterium]
MSLLQDFFTYICQTSPAPLALEIERAHGIYLFTPEGRRYIDFISGIGVANIGHGHPKVQAAIAAQMQKHLHVMVYGEYVQAAQVNYARRLAGLAPVSEGTVFFCNSGAEAIEGALKTARKFTGRKKYLAFTGGYHGDTYGALSAMASPYYRRPFEPLLRDFEFLPFNDLSALDRIDHDTAAVLFEPVQGEAGVRIPAPDFLPRLRQRCTETGALLIADEVMTGFGRTGKLFACEHWDVRPDLLCLAKALGGGLPLGAFIGRREIMHTLSHDPPLAHVTTFGGHPLSCAAGLAALEVLLAENMVANSAQIGTRCLQELRTGLRQADFIADIRGLGSFFAIEFRTAAYAQRFVAECRARGLIIGWTLHHSSIVRAAPPLCMTADELAECLEILLQAAACCDEQK